MLLSLASAAFAQVPTVMVYQVQINHGESQPKDVRIEMQLRKAQNSSAIWNQKFSFPEMKNGSVVNLALDFGAKFDWNDGAYWLATIVDGEEMGCAQLTSVPYAFMSKRAEDAMKADEAKHAETADEAKRAEEASMAENAKHAEAADESLIASTAKCVEGALTAEELIGKWSYENYGTVYEYEFNGDGTFIYSHVYSQGETTYTGTWKLNGAGIFYYVLYKVYEGEWKLASKGVLATYLDRESGLLTFSEGQDVFDNIKSLTKTEN